MAYTKLTDFAVKDALLTGNPAKVVRGTELDVEFNALAAADALNLSAASIVAATSKPTPVDADLIPLVDSAASNVLKKLTWANLKATAKTYFDTLYLGISATAANASQLLGATWASPGTIGSTTPSTGAFTTLNATGIISAPASVSLTNAGLATQAHIGGNGSGRVLINAVAGQEVDLQVAGVTVLYASGTTVGINGNTILGDASTDTLNVGNGGLIKDASGNLGVGGTPSAWTSGKAISLYITTAIFNDGTSGYYANNLYYTGTWKYKTSAAAAIYAQPASGAHEWYSLAAGVADAAATPIERMRLDASGNLGIGVIPTARNNTTLQIKDGIGFPATQVASTDANTLDDYEEGTFTPTIIGLTTAGVGTYAAQVGTYTKVGRLVTVFISLNWSAHTGTGNLQINGLPFAISATDFSPMATRQNQLALTASNVLQVYANSGSSTLGIEQVPTGGGASVAVPMDTAASLIISGSYSV